MYYPLMLDLSQFRCIVIGGGNVAYRKVKSLLTYGGKVTVISERFIEALKELPIQCIESPFEMAMLEQLRGEALLVIVATSDQACNEGIALYCRAHHILCNIATNEALSSFIVPSSMQRGDLVIAVSTGGNSPALAAKIQRELEEKYSEDFGNYVQKLGELRTVIKDKVVDEKQRRQLLRGLLEMDEEALMSYEYKG
ncbi:precorrin-2 dehydrogenase/sirohydrochlorin ferrochelatase family protein [Cellulosilyticum ruminicola]|uniref:precorrin-2 dehydrogenase/sirohydrochlorin ferrochelatase family protein n=1 Tax=Cellulosilyticum ruminicola TaxID=425254 RepID=UPI0006D10F9B|nr:bifunctional precorrin-2 dehydrogenase/sirohydrochlorin ferrochelatase [Cellulosilyticum ruminicola]